MTNYLLWLNGLDHDEDGDSTAVVELMRTNLNQVVSGDQEFTQGIADALAVPVRVVDWSVMAFRSAYYSEYPESDDWRDQYPSAWRITLRGRATGPAPDEPPPATPVEYDGFDSGWNPARRPRGSSARYLAMGTHLGGPPKNELLDRIRALRPDTPVETVTSAAGELTATRFVLDLGTVDLAEQRDELDDLDRRLGELGLVTAWPALKRRMIQLSP